MATDTSTHTRTRHNAAMHPLFLLYIDVARVVVELLEYGDVQALTGLLRDARSAFQGALDQSTSLILPEDLSLARRLIYGLHKRGLARLGGYSSVQVVTPEHVDLLVEPEVRGLVSSILVARTQSSRTRITSILDKLRGVDRLRKLNLAAMSMSLYDCLPPRSDRQEGHPDFTVPATLGLVSLRELDFGGTLPNIEYNLGSMPYLQRLHVPSSFYEKSRVSQLGRLVHLHSLELNNCTVDHIRDLTAIAKGLRVLRLNGVDLREPSTAQEKSELVQQLANLTTLRLKYERILDSSSASLVSTMTKLISIEHPISHDFDHLAPLVNLQRLNLRLDDTQRQDFSVMRRLRKLIKVTVTPMTLDWFYENFEEANAPALIAELSHLPMLEHFEFLHAYPFPLSGLSKITSCKLVCHSGNFGWLNGFETLRTLDLEIGSREPFSLGNLSQLEKLRLMVPHYSIPIPSAIVTSLVNLRTLAINGAFDDWSVLRSLTKLTALTILSPKDRWLIGGQDADGLRGLVHLRYLDLRHTDLPDVTPLLGLGDLRTVAIPETVDCTPLVESEVLSELVRILHPHHNCLWSCSHRDRRSS